MVESRELAHGDGEDAAVRLSTLYLVDLAGSERQNKSQAKGARLKEGNAQKHTQSMQRPSMEGQAELVT